MPAWLGALGMQAAGNAINAGMGMALGAYNDKRQLRQQQKLNELENKRAMEMWEKTNYHAQIEQLKKAGLNPGLLYGMSGAGGATTGHGGAPSTGGGEMGMMKSNPAELALLQAQIENIKADTENKKATTPKIGAETSSLLQGVENQKAQKELTEIQTEISQVQLKFDKETFELRQTQVNYLVSKLNEEISILETQKLLDRAQAKNKKQLLTLEIAKKVADTMLANAQTNKTYQDIANSIEQLKLNWSTLSNQEKQVQLQEIQQKWERSGLPKFLKDIMGGISPIKVK